MHSIATVERFIRFLFFFASFHFFLNFLISLGARVCVCVCVGGEKEHTHTHQKEANSNQENEKLSGETKKLFFCVCVCVCVLFPGKKLRKKIRSIDHYCYQVVVAEIHLFFFVFFFKC